MTDIARLRHLTALGDASASVAYLRALDRAGRRWCHVPATFPLPDLHGTLEGVLADHHANNWNIEEEDSRGILAWRIVTAWPYNTSQTALAWVDPDGAQCWRIGDDDSFDSRSSNACLPPPCAG